MWYDTLHIPLEYKIVYTGNNMVYPADIIDQPETDLCFERTKLVHSLLFVVGQLHSDSLVTAFRASRAPAGPSDCPSGQLCGRQ